MQPVIYDVAVSADGFIAGPHGDISKFPHHGAVVDDYSARLATYGCAIMGRATYEFGYEFGLEPGANPHPAMRTVVFSRTIALPEDRAVEVVGEDAEPFVRDLRRTADAPVYLCGGGDFAGRLAGKGLIDIIRLKRAPILYGSGLPLFGGLAVNVEATLSSTRDYGDGYYFQEFRLAN